MALKFGKLATLIVRVFVVIPKLAKVHLHLHIVIVFEFMSGLGVKRLLGPPTQGRKTT